MKEKNIYNNLTSSFPKKSLGVMMLQSTLPYSPYETKYMEDRTSICAGLLTSTGLLAVNPRTGDIIEVAFDKANDKSGEYLSKRSNDEDLKKIIGIGKTVGIDYEHTNFGEGSYITGLTAHRMGEGCLQVENKNNLELGINNDVIDKFNNPSCASLTGFEVLKIAQVIEIIRQQNFNAILEKKAAAQKQQDVNIDRLS